MDELPPKNIILQDAFWTPRLEVNARRAIFHQWEQLEASGCIDNFRILAGDKEGFREGWFFADSDAYKWLDAAARIYIHYPSTQLASLMDGLIDLLERTQADDGYLFTYNQIHFPSQRWINMQIEHELYCHGHLIEAGVSHFTAIGQEKMLSIACRAADLLVHEFLNAGPKYTPGHEEIEIALLRLYRVTGQADYLSLARHFLEQRGRTPKALFAFALVRQNTNANVRSKLIRQKRLEYLAAHPEYTSFHFPEENFAKHPADSKQRWFVSALSGQYFQQHAPIRKQTIPTGHAVRFGYLETAIAMLYRASGDETLLPALQKTWDRMVTRRMYVTGGIGSQPSIEGFGEDFELDPEYAYNETCASLASMFWNWEMALITREAMYSDLFEWQLYNAAAVGMGLSGEDYLYNNPLACHGGVTRKSWYAVPCCPSNLSRTYACLGRYICSVDAEALWIHQYFGSQVNLEGDISGQVKIHSALPWEGNARITLDITKNEPFTVWLRIPSWAGAYMVNVNGQALDVAGIQVKPLADPAAGGFDPREARFLPIRREWAPGDIIEISLAMSISLRRAGPAVIGHDGKAALTRGPLVYCLESVDNPDVDIFNCHIQPSSLKAEFDANILGGICVLRAQTTTGQPLIFVPYHLWANRGASQMTVWVNI